MSDLSDLSSLFRPPGGEIGSGSAGVAARWRHVGVFPPISTQHGSDAILEVAGLNSFQWTDGFLYVLFLSSGFSSDVTNYFTAIHLFLHIEYLNSCSISHFYFLHAIGRFQSEEILFVPGTERRQNVYIKFPHLSTGLAFTCMHVTIIE